MGRRRLLVGLSAHIFHRRATVGLADGGGLTSGRPYGHAHIGPITQQTRVAHMGIPNIGPTGKKVSCGSHMGNQYGSYIGPILVPYGLYIGSLSHLCKSDGLK